MDIKIDGITRDIMAKALDQAREGRLHILGEMNKVLAKSREQMSEWAPTIVTIKIDPEKIRDVIGKGGAVIRAITEETGTHDRHRERRHGQDRVSRRQSRPRKRGTSASSRLRRRSRSAGSTKARSRD